MIRLMPHTMTNGIRYMPHSVTNSLFASASFFRFWF